MFTARMSLTFPKSSKKSKSLQMKNSSLNQNPSIYSILPIRITWLFIPKITLSEIMSTRTLEPNISSLIQVESVKSSPFRAAFHRIINTFWRAVKTASQEFGTWCLECKFLVMLGNIKSTEPLLLLHGILLNI